MNDIIYSNSKYSVSTSWNCSAAVEFDSFVWHIIKKVEGGEETISSRKLLGAMKSASITIDLEHASQYLSRIVGFDQLGRESDSKDSAPFVVDISPPVVEDLLVEFPNSDVGRGSHGPLQFTPNKTHVSFSFVSADPESGILKCMWKLVEYPSLTAVTNLAEVRHDRPREHHIFAVGFLRDGAYQILVSCSNGAGVESTALSTSFVLDTTEPFCGIPELTCTFPPAFHLQIEFPLAIHGAKCTVKFAQQPKDG
jgi:hypothetical protein